MKKMLSERIIERLENQIDYLKLVKGCTPNFFKSEKKTIEKIIKEKTKELKELKELTKCDDKMQFR